VGTNNKERRMNMKKEDIEKLEKVIKLYKDIEKILDEVVESTKNDVDIVIPDVNGVLRSISVYLGISLRETALNRLWIEHDLRYIKSGQEL
jgi:hypothetical protein